MAADIRQCKMCGKLFHSLNNPLCSECNDEMDRRFVKVRDYIYEHPMSDITEIMEKTGVPEKNILTFLREERLVLASVSGGIITCERCSKSIASGRFCEECKAQLLKAFTPAAGARSRIETEQSAAVETKAQQQPQKNNERQGVIYSRYSKR